MKPKTPLLDKFSAGLIAGILFALSLAALFDSEVAEGVKSNWVNLAAIITAVTAAFFALHGVRRQIDHQNELNENARLASLAATKAFLPIALTEMCRIAEKGMVLRWNAHNKMSAFTSGAQIEEFKHSSARDLELSEQIISVFRDFIENASPSDGNRIALVLREYQILLARWNGMIVSRSSAEPQDKRFGGTAHWAYLYALSASVFAFSRGKANEIGPSFDISDIKVPLLSANIYYGNEIEFDKHISLFDVIYLRG